MKSLKRKAISKIIVKVSTLAIYTLTLGVYHVNSMEKLNINHELEVTKLQSEIKDNEVYKMLYEDNNERIIKMQSDYEETKNKLNFIEQQVVLSREADSKYNESNFANKDLSEYPIMTVEEMDNWILERAPKNSTFIGKGKEFLEVSKEVDLDPRYLVAHAALESTWGTSTIAKDKNNYYGIGAFNSSPYESAKTFSSAKSGILEGARWIKENYIDKGQNTLYKMQYGEKVYCTLDDGKTPDDSWITKIVSIIF